MANIDGVGPDAPTIQTESGARTSHTPYRFEILPPLAIADVAKIMSTGAEKYGVDNWRMLPEQDHLNHAMQHIFAYMAGDNQEGDILEHAKHAATRILFWLECLEVSKQLHDSIKINLGNPDAFDRDYIMPDEDNQHYPAFCITYVKKKKIKKK